jgi:hypothetical protein
MRRYEEDGFTTNTPSKEGYFLTDDGLRRVKKASRLSGIRWDVVASDPEEAVRFVGMVEYDEQKFQEIHAEVNHDDIV